MAHDACGHGNLLSLDEALARYALIRPLQATRLAPEAALHHVLAAPASAAVDLPMYMQSAVDGYALRRADLAGGAALPLAGEVRAGVAAEGPLPARAAMRIFTGGRLPDGADTVARQEIVERRDDGTIVVGDALAPGADVRQRGEELRAGAQLASAGQHLHAGLVAALAMAGVREVDAIAPPRVALLVTGDEIVTTAAPGVDGPAQASVFDANGPLVRSWFRARGLHAPLTRYVVDDEARLSAALAEALDGADLVLTTGGVSVGDHDLVRPVASALGVHEVFWQVAQKPGKPLYFGLRDAGTSAQKVLLGLPGNPGAVLIGLHVHVAAVLARLQGSADAAPAWRHGRLAAPVRSDAREQLLRMALRVDDSGQVWLDKLGRQASHMLSNLADAGALARIPAGRALEAQAVVQWLPLP
ncbi:molybdopterin molybdotransferase MoeA [Solimonas soli]|uniref:molybdopterin molybdotransferase MoeA n=1 Tax=Solimonas soli TaxID=413479 RepID=UPI0004882590|nr:molybdopterin molybdotransferase MoeA [Solimonas soli]